VNRVVDNSICEHFSLEKQCCVDGFTNYGAERI